jgi:hypothetical protein
MSETGYSPLDAKPRIVNISACIKYDAVHAIEELLGGMRAQMTRA